MYTSPTGLWEGWTKNLHVGARIAPWLVPPGLALLTLGLVAPYAGLIAAARRPSVGLAIAAGTQLASLLAMRRIADATVGLPWYYTLTQPLGQVAVLALLLGSFFKVKSGRGVTWKGRRYA